jgi:uncharacterized protein
LTTYLDTSVAVALFTTDVHAERARQVVKAAGQLVISDLTAAEFSSALAIHFRSGRATETDVRAAFATFDMWCETVPDRAEVFPSDVRGAKALIRQFDGSLRTADAIHLLIARRLGVSLTTFDNAMARAAVKLGLQVSQG